MKQVYLRGYVHQPDRSDLFPWNYDVEYFLDLGPEQVLTEIQRRFSGYAGRFVVEIDETD